MIINPRKVANREYESLKLYTDNKIIPNFLNET